MRWRRRSAVRTVALLWLALAAAAGLGFVARLALGRNLGAAGLGTFATAFAIIALLGPIAELGISTFWLEVHGEEGDAARRWYRPSARVIGASSLVAALVGAGWAAFMPAATRMVLLAVLPLAAVRVLSDLVGALCQLRERFQALAVVRLVPNGARFAPAVAAWALSAGLTATATMFAVSGGLALAGLAFALAALGRGAAPAGSPPTAREVVARAWPYSLATLFFLVYFQIDVVLIDALEGAADAGLYAAAAAILSVAYLVPIVVYRQFLQARFHRWAARDRRRLREVHRSGSRQMLVAGLVAGALVAAAGPLLLRYGFGREFADGTPALLVLALAVPVRFWSASARAVMSTRENIRRKVAADGGVALLNVALNLALIPAFGIVGAAVATVASEAALFALLSRSASRYLATP